MHTCSMQTKNDQGKNVLSCDRIFPGIPNGSREKNRVIFCWFLRSSTYLHIFVFLHKRLNLSEYVNTYLPQTITSHVCSHKHSNVQIKIGLSSNVKNVYYSYISNILYSSDYEWYTMRSHVLFNLILSSFLHTERPISQDVSHLNLNLKNVSYSFVYEWSTMRSHTLCNLISSIFIHTKRPISQDVSHLNLNTKCILLLWLFDLWQCNYFITATILHH